MVHGTCSLQGSRGIFGDGNLQGEELNAQESRNNLDILSSFIGCWPLIFLSLPSFYSFFIFSIFIKFHFMNDICPSA